ncbi:FtsK/SpoIIIE domain-containing protein [Capnocytophaga leadbetteri]|uniref:FtsK/SpoIIIE domain-containing protein n=1 Tax=Capnocytophaga leadbetteri TaxID=327575 RepID=UPI0028EEB7F2|nr:FtsK/SpoIIIE domain-containing protein [Capnocytophaga leadbetteri]
MEKQKTSMQLPVALLGQPKDTMRALLEREIVEQERYIKETLQLLDLPFKGTFHPTVERKQNVFSVKMKSLFRQDDFERVQKAFPKGYVLSTNSFIANSIEKQFLRIAIPNQSTRWVHLSELLSARQFQNTAMILPIALGVDNHDIHVVDLVTEMHWAIKNDTPATTYKGLQLVLLSLLFRQTPEEVQLVWIDSANASDSFLKEAIAPYSFTTATNPQEVLQALIAENEKRLQAQTYLLRIVVCISDAYALYQQYPEQWNALEESFKQGIHLIGSFTDYVQQQATVKKVVDFHKVFNTMLEYKRDSTLWYERTEILSPFFEKIVAFRKGEISQKRILIKDPHKVRELEKHIDKLLKRRKRDRKHSANEKLSVKTFKDALAKSLVYAQLCDSDEKVALPLFAIGRFFNNSERSLFEEMLLRIINEATYLTGDTPKKISNVAYVDFLEKSGHLLINQEAVYSRALNGKIAPFVIDRNEFFPAAFSIGISPTKIVCPIFDTLPNTDYPQLSKIVVALREHIATLVEPYNIKEIAGEVLRKPSLAKELTPTALIVEIEKVLSQQTFQLINK